MSSPSDAPSPPPGKVLVSLAATPVLYLFYAILATYLAYRWDAPSGVRHWMPVYVFLGLPFGAMSALKFGEAAMDVLSRCTLRLLWALFQR